MSAPPPGASRPADWFLPAGGCCAGAGAAGAARPSAQGIWARLRANRPALAALAFLLLVGVLTAVGPRLAGTSYYQIHLSAENLPPGPHHWFGTDELGRDLWARTWMGGRISLFIGVAAAAIDLGIGAVYGAVAAAAGGWVDDLMMRIVDVLYGIPFLLVVILLLVLVGSGLRSIVLAIALVNWIGMARLVRGQVLQLREQDYVLAARGLGVPGWRIVARHLLPGAQGPILAWISYNVPTAIFTEAFLSYLGLGVQPPLASWGSLVSTGTETFRVHPYAFAFPALAISLTMLAFYVLSDALHDALDPRTGR